LLASLESESNLTALLSVLPMMGAAPHPSLQRARSPARMSKFAHRIQDRTTDSRPVADSMLLHPGTFP
jgi:hypothetical protein